jgi:outer membrane protein OmpA-like peptidoglycan-associated protein
MKNSSIFILGIAFILTLHCGTAFAQTQATVQVPADNDGIRYGVTGLFNYNAHSARFLQIPRAVPENLLDYYFQSGMGTGFSAGAFIGIPIFRWLNLDLRASYVQRNGTLYSRLDSEIVGRRDGTGDVGIFRRAFTANLATVGSEVLLNFNPAAGLNVYVGARAEWAVAKTYRQEETLVAPSDGVFHDSGERTRNVQSGTLPDVRNLGVANMNVEVMGGIGYEIPIHPSGAWTLEPTLFYGTQLYSVVQNLEKDEYWKIATLRGGVALRYYPVREARFDSQLYKIKQLAAMEKQLLDERKKIQSELQELRQSGVLVKISLPDGLLADGTEVRNPTIRVEQFRSTQTVQLVPHIFFNENSSVIPARYRRIASTERTSYSFNRLTKLQPVEVYHHILNIIGKRLQERTEARLTLTGYTLSSGSESGNKKLAAQRAESVSDYLQDVWKIAANRLTVTVLDAAPVPVGSDAEADIRRVDIASTDPAILQAVTLESMYQTVSPPALRFSIDISAGAGLKQWSLEVSQFEGNEIKTLFNVEGTNTYSKEYIWRIDERPSSVPGFTGTLDSKLEVTDINNRNSDAPIQTTPVEVLMLADKITKKVPDARVDVITLVAQMGKEIAESDALTTFKASLSPNASLTVEGWAEGKDEANLSTDAADARARQVTQAISGIPSKIVSSKKNVAWMKALHNDSTNPEGRMYNRAVRVEVRTAVQ